MNIDAVHLAARSGTAEETQKVLNELEAELADAKARRDKTLVDIRKANEASVRDQQARLKLPGLNKEEAAAGRLIISIEMQITEAKKRLAMAANQAAARALKLAQAETAAVPADKWFEVETPDGRKVRHRHASAEGLQKILQPGYRVIAEVFAAGVDGNGGFAASIGSDAKSNMMDGLLQAHGDTLLEWLAARGIIGNPVKVVLPPNGRDLQ
jgi:hypothetical protein